MTAIEDGVVPGERAYDVAVMVISYSFGLAPSLALPMSLMALTLKLHEEEHHGWLYQATERAWKGLHSD